MDVNIIAAMDLRRGIGFEGKLPWKIKEDLNYFRSMTENSVVIMGRKTWDSFKSPLPNRTNVVISRNPNMTLDSSVLLFNSVSSAIEYYKDKKIFIIGGAEIYKEALKYANTIFLTKIDFTFQADTYMPYFDNDFTVDHSYTISNFSNGLSFHFLKFERTERMNGITNNTNHQEYQYINLIHDILSNGEKREDRTGTGTISLFGKRMVFDLTNFPLLTTKKLFVKGIFQELFWFLKGSVNNKDLLDKNVHIWDGNSSREYLDSVGLNHYQVNELGPIYGFQWRFSGAEYQGLQDYTGQGIDQVTELINGIRNSPFSRRHIINAWNPKDLKKMAIPPCHVMCQFYVRDGCERGIGKTRYLDCQLYQRSGDIGLGVPFNIASYSLLTYLIAHCCDLIPGRFIHILGDAHIYLNHVEKIKVQLGREPFPFPQLKINTTEKDIFKIKYEDLELINYQAHSAIKMDLSV